MYLYYIIIAVGFQLEVFCTLPFLSGGGLGVLVVADPVRWL